VHRVGKKDYHYIRMQGQQNVTIHLSVDITQDYSTTAVKVGLVSAVTRKTATKKCPRSPELGFSCGTSKADRQLCFGAFDAAVQSLSVVCMPGKPTNPKIHSIHKVQHLLKMYLLLS